MSDDNKVKLLKIQHALLEALSDKKIHAETEEERDRLANELSICLLKYKELVTEIEHNIYLELEDKLTKLSEESPLLEEELLRIEEIEAFYNQLIEIQTRFKETYSIYSNEVLVLSDINRLNIDLYLKRKEAIKAYLINKKNISDNKKQIEKINDELIAEEQKENLIDKKVAFLDEEILRRLLSSEGRLLITENNQEKLKYTSISSEYQDIGIYLEKDGYKGKTIEEFTNASNETKEKLMAATISYEVLPNYENKKILDEISLENITANYQLVMSKLLNEFYTLSKNSDEAIQKRERIKDLLKYRQTYLASLGIKYAADPFARLHVNEQLEELKKYENNSRAITRLRRTLAELNERIETMTADNVQNLAMLEESELALTNHKIAAISESSIPKFNDYIVDIKPAEVRTLDNQVVSISEVNPSFNHKKCQEVTNRVIRKVYEILIHPEVNMPSEKAPELVIEQSINNSENIFDDIPPLNTNQTEDKDINPVLSTDIFSKTEPFVVNVEEPSVVLPEVTSNTISNPELVIEPKMTNSPEPSDLIEPSEVIQEEKTTNNDMIFDAEMPDLLTDSPKQELKDDIFSDITPFETPTMFTEKIDSVEPEKKIPEVSLSIEKQPEPPKMFNEMTMELEKSRAANDAIDFWSTDADIYNISSPQIKVK